MSDLPFLTPDPDPSRPEREPFKCRRHWWGFESVYVFDRPDGSPRVVRDAVERCLRCGSPRDHSAAKRNRNNRSRGTRDELAVARLLGGEKVGELGYAWDVTLPGYLRVQCKRLDRWPSIAKVIEWLDAIPDGPELRAVTLADTPGPGRRTRRLIVMDLESFAAWHGRAER